MRRVVLIALLASIVAVAVAARPVADHAPKAAGGPCTARTTGEFTMSLRVGKLQRTAVVHVPRAGAGRRLAVVLAFHGAGRSGPEMAEYSGLSPLADADHFVVVYPSAASANHYWTLNNSNPALPDDVGFVRALISALPGRVCMDPTRVYATGVSNGGGFVARIGCELSSQLAAIATVAGGYGNLDPCQPDRPVAVLEIHGAADPVVPYNGKPPSYAGSVPRFLAQWADLDDCPPPQPAKFVAPRTERFDWAPCADGTEVLHLKLSGVGHTWPGSYDSRSAPIDAGRTMWRFFRGRVLAPPRTN